LCRNCIVLSTIIDTELKAKHKLEEANGEVVKLILEKWICVFSKNRWVELQTTNSVHNSTILNINVEQLFIMHRLHRLTWKCFFLCIKIY